MEDLTISFKVRTPERDYQSDMNTAILHLRDIYDIVNRGIPYEEASVYNAIIEQMKNTLDNMKVINYVEKVE